MSIHGKYKQRIDLLIKKYHSLRVGKESLLKLIDEAEITEQVYNSNAIENSTLTLEETEKILLELEVSRTISVREVFETKNLARVMEYVWKRAPTTKLSLEIIVLMHQMLLSHINDDIAGRVRQKGEYVRIGTYIAPGPEHLELGLAEVLNVYHTNQEYFLDGLVRCHLAFETLHPFVDGNGRIGRVIMNYQLYQNELPSIIIRDKEKHLYYQAFKKYQNGMSSATDQMGKVIALAFLESLHKRIVYLEGKKILPLAIYAKANNLKLNTLLNKAKRQTIPAFRERGVWSIANDV